MVWKWDWWESLAQMTALDSGNKRKAWRFSQGCWTGSRSEVAFLLICMAYCHSTVLCTNVTNREAFPEQSLDSPSCHIPHPVVIFLSGSCYYLTCDCHFLWKYLPTARIKLQQVRNFCSIYYFVLVFTEVRNELNVTSSVSPSWITPLLFNPLPHLLYLFLSA
jgi:hypothetical protein